MDDSESLLGTRDHNPFSPGFGQPPTSIVGRDDLLADLGAGLVTGPLDNRFTSILTGVRGSGKTVVLSEIERRAAGDGWAVMSLDAGTAGLLDRIRTAVIRASRAYEWLDLAELGVRRSATKSRSVKIGPYRSEGAETEHFEHGAETELRDLLTHMAAKATDNGTSVLLTVDEIHNIDKDEARRLSNDLQHITKRASLPLAFIGAGLPELMYTILQDKKITFFRRCRRFQMSRLSSADAIRGIRLPVRGAGGAIDDEALELIAASASGWPYQLQAIGHAAWAIAGAPAHRIDVSVARHAVREADNTVENDISIPAFYDLSATEQRYLTTLAQLGGRASTAAITGHTGLSRSTAMDIDRKLRLSEYIVKHDDRTRSMTDLVPSDVVLREAEVDRYVDAAPPADDGTTRNALSDEHQTGAPSPRPSAVCRKWMPRSQTRCILPAGHRGGCRSKRTPS